MCAKIITNIFGVTILVNNILSQNNTNISKSTTSENYPPEYYFPMTNDYNPYVERNQSEKKVYEEDKFGSLFEQYAKYIGFDITSHRDHRQAEDYFLVFCHNLRRINHLYNIYNTTTFSINKYTHYKSVEFTNWLTGFNGTGLTQDDIISFNRSLVQNVPPTMDWSNDILQDYFQDTKCKNSYVFSALSKLSFLFRIDLDTLYEN